MKADSFEVDGETNNKVIKNHMDIAFTKATRSEKGYSSRIPIVAGNWESYGDPESISFFSKQILN